MTHDHYMQLALQQAEAALAEDEVILNAHNAFYSEQGLMDMRVKGSEACRRALLGEPLRNVIN